MNRILTPLTEYFTSLECAYELDPAREVLHVGIEGDNARWRLRAFQDDGGRFVTISLIPVKAPQPRRPACAELFALVNLNLNLGNFDLDFSDGELGYCTAVPLAKKGRLHADVIEHVLQGHQVIVDRFMPVISSVLFAGVSPEKALALAAEPPAPVAQEPRFSLN